MNKWLVLPLLALVTACVSYYQPEAALEDGVYYAEDDPSYSYNADDYYSAAVLYPWASLDYFYFAYWPYPGYRFGFFYPYEYGFASWGYPYGYYGYFAYASPWYSPWYYSYYDHSYWRPYRKNCHHQGRCPDQDNDDRDAGDDRYAGDDGRYARDGGEENAFYSNDVRHKMNRARQPSAKRYVVKPPAGRTGYQGMAARNYEPGKPGRSRSKPAYPAAPGPGGGKSTVTVSAPETRTAPDMYSGRQGQSPSIDRPSRSQISGSAKSSRRKDRD